MSKIISKDANNQRQLTFNHLQKEGSLTILEANHELSKPQTYLSESAPKTAMAIAMVNAMKLQSRAARSIA